MVHGASRVFFRGDLVALVLGLSRSRNRRSCSAGEMWSQNFTSTVPKFVSERSNSRISW
jgi:hypothetical protein